MLSYELTARAEEDLRSVRSWYEQLGQGLGKRVLDAILDVIQLSRQRPTSFPEVRDGIRVARCRRFPYRIYFAVTDAGISVLAVYHTSRDPERWDDPDRE